MDVPLGRSVGRVPLGKLAFELFLVFVTVSAALFANAWWQGRQNAAAGRAAIAAFAGEMRANKEQIATRLEHHKKVLANAEALLQELARGDQVKLDVVALRSRLTDGKGMRTPLLSRAAWETTVAAGIASEIPLPLLQRVASVYELQKRLDAVLDNLIANFTSPAYFDAGRLPATVTAFMVTFSMIVELEVDQTNAYDGCLPALEAA